MVRSDGSSEPEPAVAALGSRAEIAKLARLLEREPEALAYLERVSADELRALRDRITDVLFDADRGPLQTMAAASRVIPVGILVKLAEGVFGPLLCARIAGLMEPDRAVEIATRLSPAFLADVSVSLDPRRATDVIATIPADRIVAVSNELLRRQEYVTMGSFVGHLSNAALRAAVAEIDAASLLRIAFVLEGKERLDDIVAMLSDDQVADTVTAAEREQLWPEVLDLLGNLGEPNRRRFATLAADLDDQVLAHTVEAALAKQELWEPLASFVALMDEPTRARVSRLVGPTGLPPASPGGDQAR